MKPAMSSPVDPETDPAHSKNFGLAVFYYCCLRVGWIFKTESIVMPAVLDVIGGAAWLRGFLPMFNRLGQSLPPFLASDFVRQVPAKKWILFGSSCTMGVCFLSLALLWRITGGQTSWYLPIAFLIVYAIFFMATGINQLVLNTLIGKLIRIRRRGRLALVGTGVGALLAVICAHVFLNRWLPPGTVSAAEYRFDYIFGLTGSMFVIAGFSAALWAEKADHPTAPRRKTRQLFLASWQTLKTNSNFLVLAVIAGLFGMCLTLFPHYQRLGRDRFDLDLTALIPWVLAQNIGAALFSIPAGWIADRLGTRIVLQVMLLVVCIAPVLALGLAALPVTCSPWYTLVFGLLGITPVTMRIFNYYTLEIAPQTDHPRYLSTLSLAMSAPPFVLSTPVGMMVDWFGFELVFGLVTTCMLMAWGLTFWLDEPRDQASKSTR